MAELPSYASQLNFGALLRLHRTAAGISQEELAERAGLSRRGIADLERGARRLPYAETIRRLSAALKLEPNDQSEFLASARQARISAAELNQRAPSPPHAPVPLSSFVGRQEQIADVCARLATSRLVTLVGAGGIGKTRLALEVLRHLGNAGHDIAWVDLAPLRGEELVAQTIATSLGVRDEPGRPLIETLIDAIASRPVLLAIDNCEHVLRACVELVDALIQGCPSLHMLVTSREPLHIMGEIIWRVPALQVPEAGARAVRDILDTEAVALFVERAQATDRTFTVTERNASVLGELCRRLDGLPLVIELAAARTRVLAPAQILARLGDALDLLIGSDRAVPGRQQTLRATLDWSYELLAAPERRLFRQLAVFAAGFELEAIASVCGFRASTNARQPQQIAQRRSETQLLELLAGLIDKSLVLTQMWGETMRYGLLEPVRQYALEQLTASGEQAATRNGHAAYFLDFAELAEQELMGPSQAAWLERLEREHDNLRAALGFVIDVGDADSGLRLAGALYGFWELRGHLTEGRRWLEALLVQEETNRIARPAIRAKAFTGAGVLAWQQGDYAHAKVLHEQALASFRELGDTRGITLALCNLGVLAKDQGEYERAAALTDESLALARDMRNKQGIALSLNNMGVLAKDQGQFQRARALLEESLALARDLGDMWGIALALNSLGVLTGKQGEYERSTALLEECLTLRRDLGTSAGSPLAWRDWPRPLLHRIAPNEQPGCSGRRAHSASRSRVPETRPSRMPRIAFWPTCENAWVPTYLRAPGRWDATSH